MWFATQRCCCSQTVGTSPNAIALSNAICGRDVRLPGRRVDRSAQEVVGHEQAEEGQPLEHHPAPAAPGADAERRHAERQPEEQLVARERHAPAGDDDGERDDVGDGRTDDDDPPDTPRPAGGRRRRDGFQ